MDLTLEQLLASLSTGLDKSASDEEDEDKKDEKEDKEKPAFLKGKDEKKEDKSDDEDEESDEGQTKEASAQGAALAREIMEKVAGLNLESVTGMNKTASSAGKTLAQALIQKLASAGDMVTENGIPGGVVPNKNQVDNAQMKAEDDAKVKPMPTSDGLRPTGTINEIFDAIVADALSQGAASTDQVHGTGVAAQEGAVEDHALPNQVKAAAMNELLEQRFDFDQAADMVKEAGEHKLKGYLAPNWQENSIAKEHGKEGLKGFGANAKKFLTGSLRVSGRGLLEGAAGQILGGVAGHAANKASGGKMRAAAAVGNSIGGLVGSTHGVVKSLKNQAAEAHQKYAAMSELIESGIDFDQAADMVKQASAELEDQFEKAAAVDHLVENGVDFEDAVELVKQAAEEIAAEEFGMAKAAALGELLEEGFDFDDALEMIKQASAGDMITDDGVYEGAVPNKNQVDNAQMHAEGASYIKPMPTSDGLRPTGTINEIFDAVIADALSQGAASTDQVHETGVAAQEGAVEDIAVPNQVKAAAMNELLEAGIDFDQAAEMIKEAGAQLLLTNGAKKGLSLGKKVAIGAGATGAAAAAGGAYAKKKMNEKKASAMGDLLGAGFEFEKAAQIVKEAAGKAMILHPNIINGTAKEVFPLAKRPGGVMGALGRMGTKTKIGLGLAGAAGVGAAGYAMTHPQEKKAEAMSILLEQGVDFDQAAEMVKQASTKLGV